MVECVKDVYQQPRAARAPLLGSRNNIKAFVGGLSSLYHCFGFDAEGRAHCWLVLTRQDVRLVTATNCSHVPATCQPYTRGHSISSIRFSLAIPRHVFYSADIRGRKQTAHGAWRALPCLHTTTLCRAPP
jgi:hypothetical protein